MKLGDLAKRAEKLIVDNSPAISTGIGVAGVLVTAYLTGKAAIKAERILSEESPHLEIKDKLLLVWGYYIPPAITASLTISAIIFSNRIGNRRATALAVAYSLSERAYEEYKAKVIENVGAKKEQSFRDQIAQDRVTANPVSSREVIISGSGNVLCYEAYTGRYFTSDMETLRKAQNDINHQILNDSFATLSDYYDAIGLPHTSTSDEIGWNADKLLDLKFSATISEDGRPCMSVDFGVSPIRHYYRLQ